MSGFRGGANPIGRRLRRVESVQSPLRGGLGQPYPQQVKLQGQRLHLPTKSRRLLLAGAFEEGDSGIEQAEDFAEIGWRH